MKKSVKYRLANSKDLPGLARMRYEFSIEVSDNDNSIAKSKFLKECLNFLKKKMKTRDWYYFIAELDGELIGHAFLAKIEMVPRPHRKFKHFGYLTNMYVKAEFRNKKIGKQLIEKVKKFGKTNGYELIIVWPSDNSKSLYQRSGFLNDNEIHEARF